MCKDSVFMWHVQVCDYGFCHFIENLWTFYAFKVDLAITHLTQFIVVGYC